MLTNAFDSAAQIKRMPVERAWLMRPTLGEWGYCHHAHLTHFDGKYFAMWSNGRVHEDDCGQRVLMSTSSDFANWTAPQPLVDLRIGKHSDIVHTACGWHQHDGTLVAYVGHYEYRPEALIDGRRRRDSMYRHHQDTMLSVLTTRDGATWTQPRELGLRMVANQGPQRTHSGRLIIAGNVMFPYTDDPTGLGGWVETGVYPPGMAGNFVDDSETLFWVQKACHWPGPCHEGAFFQTDDGVLHMVLRSNTPWLWVADSSDDGKSWSPPTQTQFSDNGTRFHFGRLPDGRFYYVGCPDQTGGSRWRLVLSLSQDGVRFDKHYVLADEKYVTQCDSKQGGQYGYPHTLFHDGYICTIFSRLKEAVEVLRVRIDSL